jgi:hypothetical protein
MMMNYGEMQASDMLGAIEQISEAFRLEGVKKRAGGSGVGSTRLFTPLSRELTRYVLRQNPGRSNPNTV